MVVLRDGFHRLKTPRKDWSIVFPFLHNVVINFFGWWNVDKRHLGLLAVEVAKSILGKNKTRRAFDSQERMWELVTKPFLLFLLGDMDAMRSTYDLLHNTHRRDDVIRDLDGIRSFRLCLARANDKATVSRSTSNSSGYQLNFKVLEADFHLKSMINKFTRKRSMASFPRTCKSGKVLSKETRIKYKVCEKGKYHCFHSCAPVSHSLLWTGCIVGFFLGVAHVQTAEKLS